MIWRVREVKRTGRLSFMGQQTAGNWFAAAPFRQVVRRLRRPAEAGLIGGEVDLDRRDLEAGRAQFGLHLAVSRWRAVAIRTACQESVAGRTRHRSQNTERRPGTALQGK